jgi:hypothetical protein
VRNRPTLYVTKHDTGKRQQRRIVKGMQTSRETLF